MQSGHIKHYRKEMESYVWSLKPAYYKVWQTILLSVNWKESTMEFGGEPRTIKPGQMVTGREDLANRAGKGVSESQVQRALEKFESSGMIERESNNKGSLLTVVNWGKYQKTPDSPNNNRTSTEQQSNSERTSTEQRANTYEEGNKCNKGRKEKLETINPSGLKDRPDPESADFQEQQKYIISVISESDIPETSLWGLVGKWIHNFDFDEVADAVEELSMKGKLEGLEKPGYIVGAIKNDFDGGSSGYVSLPATDELQDRSEGYWKKVLPDCYSKEEYPSMIYEEDVRRVEKFLDCSMDRAVSVLEDYFTKTGPQSKDDLKDWIKERGEAA